MRNEVMHRGRRPPPDRGIPSLRAALPALLLSLLLAVPPLAQDARAERRTYTLTAAQLTGQLAARFPQRRCLLGLACVTLTDPVVRLADGDPRLFVAVRASPDLGEQALGEGTIELAGRPRYDPASGAFYVDDPAVLRADFPGVPQAAVAQAAGLSRELLTDYLRRTPVWVLDERDAQQALAKLVLREVAVRDGRLSLVIGDD